MSAVKRPVGEWALSLAAMVPVAGAAVAVAKVGKNAIKAGTTALDSLRIGGDALKHATPPKPSTGSVKPPDAPSAPSAPGAKGPDAPAAKPAADTAPPTAPTKGADDAAPSSKPKDADGPATGCKSFSGDTHVVMADGSTKPIDEIEVGDEVLATDPETGETGAREVTALWVHQDELIDLEVAGDTVTTTEDHPFWNVTDGEWQDAQDLDAGDLLQTSGGNYLTVRGLDEASTYTAAAYNLTVDDIHTYYVVIADADVLVHNTNGIPDGACDVPIDDIRAVRDAKADEVGSKHATVTAGADPNTGRIVAGCSSNPTGCAELDVVRQLDIDPSDVQFSDAVRPRTGAEVPICHNCQEVFDPSQFPPGTEAVPGGAWDAAADALDS